MGTPQVGILTRPQGHLLLVALTFNGDRTPSATRKTFEALRQVVHHELTSDLDEFTPASPKDQPSPETGELGFEDHYNRYFLTITLGIAAIGFDALGVPAEQRPADLVPIPWQSLGDSPDSAESGDLILQICSDNVYINEHVVRRIEEELGDQLQVVWTQTGVQRFTSRAARTSRREGRALIGFHDGTSNLSPRHNDDDYNLVFIDPKAVNQYPLNPSSQSGPYNSGPNFPTDLRPVPTQEPDWTRGGTYMVVRASLNDIKSWDTLPVGDQEHVVGRYKYSGASLDLEDKQDQLEVEPAFAADQQSTVVPLISHTRKTNPRRASESDVNRRIFRRGYPLVERSSDGLQRGLVFICFGRTITTQFEFIVRAWMNNPDFPTPGAGVDSLHRFDQRVLCGGYYFVPPLEHKTRAWSWCLPELSNRD